MLSSLTGVSGSTSPANYSSGSTFQDCSARYRTEQGLPAVSIDLGSSICQWDASVNVAWKHDRRFWPLQTSITQDAKGKNGASSNGKTQKSLKDNLECAVTWDEAVQCCVDALMWKVSDMFALTLEEVDPSLPLAHYGVDSLVAVEVCNWLSVSARADASIFDIMQSASLKALATKLAEKS